MQSKIKLRSFILAFVLLAISYRLYPVDSHQEFFSNEVMWHIKRNLLANITSDTNSFPDAPQANPDQPQKTLSGAVITAPFIKHSENNPISSLYMSQKTGAITMLSILDELKYAVKNKDQPSIDLYGSIILDYIYFWEFASAQKKFSPGIDRFYLSGEPVIDWFFPQNASPALTSIVMSEFASIVLFKDEQLKIKDTIISYDFISQKLLSSDGKGLIHLNLSYIVDNSRKESYDLWETCLGEMFSTRILQIKALCAGSALSAKTGNISLASKYISAADLLIKLTLYNYQEFSYNSKKYTAYCEMSSLPQNLIFPLYPKYKDKSFDRYRGMSINSSILIATMLGNLSEYSSAASWVSKSLETDPFLKSKFNSIVKTYKKSLSPSSPKMIRTMKLLADHCFSENGLDAYEINENLPVGISLIGRYPGDLHLIDREEDSALTKGNPWFVCSLTLAQYYYTLANELKSATYKSLGDKQMSLIFKHFADKDKNTGKAFTMSQQLDRKTGSPISTSDYTWSYAQYLSAFHAYKLTEL